VTPLEAQLHGRLELLGLRPVERVRLTENRTVMVSLSRTRVLSVHRGYAQAPDRVLKAIVRFVARGTPRDLRKAAQHEILSFHVAEAGTQPRRERRPERAQPGDAESLERLGLLFGELNQRHFMGLLPTVPIRLSGRMSTRLGQLTMDLAGHAVEISISRRHLVAHGWDEAAHTLLHEMVHLWQHAQGHAVDHGPHFRNKAREVGVAAAARRWVRKKKTLQLPRLEHREWNGEPPLAIVGDLVASP
jgi:hypothetical protein